MADSNQEQEKWKRKYLESLEQLEKKEHDWRETDQLLRRGLSRVALISHGVDANLDNQLKKLRTALQHDASVDEVNLIVDKISAHMKRLDEAREKHTPPLDGAAVLLKIVEGVNFPLSMVAEVSQLKVNLSKPDADENLPSLINEFARLVANAFYGVTTPVDSVAAPVAQQPEEKRGWLQKVFNREGRRHEDEEVLKESESLTEPEYVPLLKPDTTASVPAVANREIQPTVAVGDRIIEDAFLEIVESLSFPKQFNGRVQQLKEQLTKGLEASAIKAVTAKVVELVVDMRSAFEREKEELELFLQQMTQRLTELDGMVEGAESQRLASLAGGRQLDEEVKAQVNNIESTVESVTDLPQMKSVIQGSLEKIRHHLAEQREQEELRQEQLEGQLKNLTQKLQQMEGESEELKQRLAKERLQALTDPLTGAPNRLAFEQRLQQEFARWLRYNHPLTLMICDVDHFKKINDTYGHKAGDRALMAIVKTIQFHLRETDFFARIGGEEFAVLLPDTTMEGAETVAEKLRKSVEMSEYVYQGNPVPITISGGYAQFQPGNSVDDVYVRADKALYRAKHSGRNQFHVAN